MNWRIKATIQKILSSTPGGARLHYQLQRRCGGLRDVATECRERLLEACTLIERLIASGVDPRGAHMLEVGTGYYPALPMCMYLAGAGRVLTGDLKRLLKEELVRACADVFESEAEALAAASPLSPDEFRRRLRHLLVELREGSGAERATEGCVDYRAPFDARRTGLDAGALDVVFSNNVLEHVPPVEIEALFLEARRILKSGGLLLHQIDCGDHYADVDASISKYNYLRYGEREWRFWDNAFLYQNRLRASDFERTAELCGFESRIDDVPPSERELMQLQDIPLAPCFLRYDARDLRATSFALIGRPKAATP